MKELRDFTKRRTDRADLARAALKVCHGQELVEATVVINKTAFSATDVKFWHPILSKAEAV